MNRRPFPLALIALLVSLGLICGTALAQTPKRGGTLRVSYGNEIANLDFHTAPGYEMMWVAMNVGCGLVNITPDGKYTRLHRISPNEPWRVLRTRLRTEGVIPGSDEGGQPSGFFTGATGVTVYRGDAWPEAFRGALFTAEAANNLLYRANVSIDGLQLSATRADAPRAEPCYT